MQDEEGDSDDEDRPPRHYSAPRDWNRMDWERRGAFLKPHEFKRFYRFSLPLFNRVVVRLKWPQSMGIAGIGYSSSERCGYWVLEF